MKLLDDPERARRLALAILSDVTLYNQEAIASGGDLTAPVAEGRELYRSRTAPSLHGIYEELVAERGYDGVRTSAGSATRPAAYAAEPAVPASPTGLPVARPRFVVEPPAPRREFSAAPTRSPEQRATDRVLVAMFTLGVLILGLLGALFALR